MSCECHGQSTVAELLLAQEALTLEACFDGSLKKVLEACESVLVEMMGRALTSDERKSMKKAKHTGELVSNCFVELSDAVCTILVRGATERSTVKGSDCCQLCFCDAGHEHWFKCDDVCKCSKPGWRHEFCARTDRWGESFSCIGSTLQLTPMNLASDPFSLSAAEALNKMNLPSGGDAESNAEEGTFAVRMVHNEQHKYAPGGKAASDYLATKAANIECTRKCFVVFQKLRGAWMIVFVFFAQEYNHECEHAPNQGICSLEYVDSYPHITVADGVKARTLWIEVLASYFLNAAQRGFKHGYIWACTPMKDGDAYILPEARVFEKRRQRAKRQKNLVGFYGELTTRIAEDVPRAAPLPPTGLFGTPPKMAQDMEDQAPKALDQGDRSASSPPSMRARLRYHASERPTQQLSTQYPWPYLYGDVLGNGLDNFIEQQTKTTMLTVAKVEGCTAHHTCTLKVGTRSDKADIFYFSLPAMDSASEAKAEAPPMTSEIFANCDAFKAFCSRDNLTWGSVAQGQYATAMTIYELHAEQSQDPSVLKNRHKRRAMAAAAAAVAEAAAAAAEAAKRSRKRKPVAKAKRTRKRTKVTKARKVSNVKCSGVGAALGFNDFETGCDCGRTTVLGQGLQMKRFSTTRRESRTRSGFAVALVVVYGPSKGKGARGKEITTFECAGDGRLAQKFVAEHSGESKKWLLARVGSLGSPSERLPWVTVARAAEKRRITARKARRGGAEC